MKKFLLTVLSLLAVSFASWGSQIFAATTPNIGDKLSIVKTNKISQPIQKTQPSKTLVAYFSATGHTANVAKSLAKTLNASIVEIIPAEPYTGADLDWQAKNSRASKEHADPASRPIIREANLTLAPFDTIYLGFPIWWGEAPHIILTYIETHDLSGKKIILFATSGGSGFGNIVSTIQKRLPKSIVIEGRVFPGFIAEEDIQTQVNDWLTTSQK